jgi:hypothetical protein
MARTVVTSVVLAAVVGVAAGCGSGHATTSTSAPVATPTTARTSALDPGPAPRLVYFKRVQGVDPMASQLTVDADGRAVAVVTLGGLSGEKKHAFVMAPGRLRQLRAILGRTRLHDTTCCDPRDYVYWITAGSHTWRLQQQSVTPAMRPLVHELDAITDAHTTY